MMELLLTRLFSVVLYYHFAFMAVSIALLGMGGGGLLVYLNRQRFPRERLPQWLAWLGILLSVMIVITLAFVVQIQLPLGFRLGNALRLVGIFVLASVPFFFAGAMLSLVIWHFSESIHRVYFYDLIGAALGSLAILPALEWLGAPTATVFAALLTAVSTVLLSLATGGDSKLRHAAVAVALACAVLVGANLQWNLLDLKYAKGDPTSDEVYARWNAISRVCVHPIRERFMIKIDCDAGTGIAPFDFSQGVPPDAQAFFNRSGQDLAQVLHPGSKTLIIGSGGGMDVARALAHGSQRVVAVEINPLIARDLMLNHYRDESHGIYTRPEVEVIVDDARSAIRRANEQFDVIQSTLIDTWAGTAAGAFALTESFLYTTDAFQEYLARLSEHGILTVTRWEFAPPRQAIRVVSLGRAALERMGARRPADHVMVVGEDGGRLVSVLIKKSPFTQEETRSARAFLAERPALIPIYLPDGTPENEFRALLQAPSLEGYAQSYAYDISAVGDSQPFFFFTTRWSRLGSLLSGPREDLKSNLALLALVLTCGFSAVAALGFLALPRLFGKGPRGGPGTRALWFYFLAIGVAFMITEIAFIQTFILFMGHPTFGITVVIFSMLVGSGLGSRWSGRLRDPERSALVIPLLLAVALAILQFAVLPLGVPLGLPLSRLVRGIVAVAVLAPVAFVMGMPFPTGVRAASRAEGDVLPWLWSANSAGSVVGSAGAILVATTVGIPMAGVLGAACYLLAGAAAFLAAARARELAAQPA